MSNNIGSLHRESGAKYCTAAPLAALLRNDRGNTLIYVTLIFGVLLGVTGLALDSTRLYVSDTEAQAAADAAAIAAAAQLNETATAITRAQNAAMNTPLVTNKQTFGETGTPGTTVITGMRFLTGLPASDDTPIDSSYETANPLLATLVEVTTETVTHRNSFLPVLGANATTTHTATSVAGRGQAVCRITPFAICNPNEAPPPLGDGMGAGFDVTDWIGHQIKVKEQGPGSDWAPGNFGFLDDPIYAGGAPTIALNLAISNPPTQCYDDTANTRTGGVNSLRSALNTRFDMYDQPYFGGGCGALGGCAGGGQPDRDPRFRPAMNVIKGRNWTGPVGNPCNSFQELLPPTMMALPEDSNLISDLTARIGNGDWNCLLYWISSHDPIVEPMPAGCLSLNPTISRYDVYRYEIDNNYLTDRGGSYENPNPECYGGAAGTITDDPDRRIIQFAVMNCDEWNVRGNSVDVPVLAYIKAFLTRPVGNESAPGNNDFTVFLEVIGEIEAGDADDVLKEIIQIYR